MSVGPIYWSIVTLQWLWKKISLPPTAAIYNCYCSQPMSRGSLSTISIFFSFSLQSHVILTAENFYILGNVYS